MPSSDSMSTRYTRGTHKFRQNIIHINFFIYIERKSPNIGPVPHWSGPGLDSWPVLIYSGSDLTPLFCFGVGIPEWETENQAVGTWSISAFILQQNASFVNNRRLFPWLPSCYPWRKNSSFLSLWLGENSFLELHVSCMWLRHSGFQANENPKAAAMLQKGLVSI